MGELNCLGDVCRNHPILCPTLVLQVLKLPFNGDKLCGLSANGAVKVPIVIVIYALRKVVDNQIRTRR